MVLCWMCVALVAVATTQLLSVMKRLSTNKHLHHRHHPNVDDQAEEMFQIEHICLHHNPPDDGHLHTGGGGSSGLVRADPAGEGDSQDICHHTWISAGHLSSGTV